mmetsp:Transcript_25496/g.58823  ORF Transcript_25496/g.58823 Transcript_25496/m.58823 type:complete len:317 (+) Transcript_25496:456-1406(+)
MVVLRGPVQRVPPVAVRRVRLRPVLPQRLHPLLPPPAVLQSAEDHEGGPSVLVFGGIVGVLEGEGLQNEGRVRLSARVPGVQEDVVPGGGGGGGGDLVLFSGGFEGAAGGHHLALFVDDLVVGFQLRRELFVEETDGHVLLAGDFVFGGAEEKDFRQVILEEVEGAHDALHREAEDHAFVPVQSHGHGHAHDRAAHEFRGEAFEVDAVGRGLILFLGGVVGIGRESLHRVRGRGDVAEGRVSGIVPAEGAVNEHYADDLEQLHDAVQDSTVKYNIWVGVVQFAGQIEHGQHHEHFHVHGRSRWRIGRRRHREGFTR